MKAKHDIDPVLIDHDLQPVDLLVIGDNGIAPGLIAFEETLAGILQIAFGQTGHHENVGAQLAEGLFKVGKNMGRLHESGISDGLLVRLFGINRSGR